jgi:tRNA-dihydrouridine synthase A
MRESELVGDRAAARKAAVKILVTVKCRIGVADQDAAESLAFFAEEVIAAGVDALSRMPEKPG